MKEKSFCHQSGSHIALAITIYMGSLINVENTLGALPLNHSVLRWPGSKATPMFGSVRCTVAFN